MFKRFAFGVLAGILIFVAVLTLPGNSNVGRGGAVQVVAIDAGPPRHTAIHLPPAPTYVSRSVVRHTIAPKPPVVPPTAVSRPVTPISHQPRYVNPPATSYAPAPNPSPSMVYAPPVSGLAQWLTQYMTLHIRHCESGDDYTIIGYHGGVVYYGAWQANAAFWIGNGGDPSYLFGNHFNAPRWMQDSVAYRGYLARGYSPWSCARL